ncbi:hypothetical protein [Aliarcobacter lanthieri]|uniref:hypothetical protein n=1 Tax=Aliarcobacter lanthieri TaxID=1355374 RepID=UPI000479D93D|nr:hypothetical protein [Aliarcobacter lanthieri]
MRKKQKNINNRRKYIRKRWLVIEKSRSLLKDHYVTPIDFNKIRKYEKRKSRIAKRTKTPPLSNLELGIKIDFEDNINNLFNITKQFKKYINSHIRKGFKINHNELKEVSIDGLLYLVSQITKITNISNISNTKKDKPKNKDLKYNKRFGLQNADDKLKYLFHSIGYWNYFGIKKPYEIPQNIEDNYFLSIKSSTISDIKSLNYIKNFIKDQVSIFDEYELEYKLDDAIKEAMGNSLEHGYPKDFMEIGKDKGRWWICGHFDNKTKILQIIFYDYGIGIRESISRNMGKNAEKEMWDRISDNVFKNDADLIEDAVQGQLSKYKHYSERDRGKGFKRFQNLAKSLNLNCELKVISGKGKYIFTYDKITKNKYTNKYNLDNSIDGMLIMWKIETGDING